MIPSDHFVRYYNEVFKALEAKGHEHLRSYWNEIGRLQVAALGESFREGGLQAAYDYWSVIKKEENCGGDVSLTEDYFEFRMDCCPSLSKALDNDASSCEFYCDHCMGWVQRVAEYAGLHAVGDMHSRSEPRCVLRLYNDKEKADAFEALASLPSRPYADSGDE